MPDSAADKAGLRRGMIVSVNGKKINTFSEHGQKLQLLAQENRHSGVIRDGDRSHLKSL